MEEALEVMRSFFFQVGEVVDAARRAMAELAEAIGLLERPRAGAVRLAATAAAAGRAAGSVGRCRGRGPVAVGVVQDADSGRQAMSAADVLIALIDATSEALHRIVDEKDEADEFSLTFLTLSDLRHGVSELGRMEGELAELRAELKAARAQRDATQRALHKANHDNDELRRQVAAPKAMGGRSAAVPADLKRLFHGDYYGVG
jgi:hypothetical protein